MRFCMWESGKGFKLHEEKFRLGIRSDSLVKRDHTLNILKNKGVNALPWFLLVLPESVTMTLWKTFQVLFFYE